MTKTDWTAETTDRLRTIVEFVNGRCTNEEAGRKCLGFIMQYGESWLERIAADEMAVPDGYTAILSDGKRYWADKPGLWGDWRPYYIGSAPAQPAQEQPGWKVPDGITVKVSGYLPKQRAVEIRFDEPLPAWICEPGVSVVVAPTPPKEK